MVSLHEILTSAGVTNGYTSAQTMQSSILITVEAVDDLFTCVKFTFKFFFQSATVALFSQLFQKLKHSLRL